MMRDENITPPPTTPGGEYGTIGGLIVPIAVEASEDYTDRHVVYCARALARAVSIIGCDMS